jgi:predicted amidohydrolase YtcJ
VVTGGKIDLDQVTGQPNGILKENAMRLIWKMVPRPGLEAVEEACLLACSKAVEAGLTGVHWMIESTDEIQAVMRLDSERKLPLRVHLGLQPKLLNTRANLHLPKRTSNSKVKMGFVKLFADGSLGSRTAALKEPYSDEPSSDGLLLHPQKELYQLILEAHKSGLQVAVHAIGDRAIESVADAYEEALKQFPRRDHRHRIEHCSILHPELIKRMKSLGLIASVQPHFVVSDFWLVDRVGEERAHSAFPFKTLMKEGVVTISGSDCPVEKISPLLGIWAAVAKRGSEESLDAKQALETYTLNAAYASFNEAEIGTIEVGKLADLTILSDDLYNVEPDMIKTIKVKTTIVDGEIVYSEKDSTRGQAQ